MVQKTSRQLFAALMALLLAAALSGPAAAQILPGFGGGSNKADADTALADAIRQAAESGVSVVVIGTDGELISATAPKEPAPDTAAQGGGMEGGSTLMRAQAEVLQFRERLKTRIAALPNSLIEVAYILRATSPDGRIMTYVEVLFWSLVLFAGAGLVTRLTYVRLFARRFVVARVMQNPQGYKEKMPFLVLRFLIGVGGTLLAMLLAYVAGSLIFGPAKDLSIQFTITAIYAGFFIARTVSDLWRMVLSPYLGQYRIPRFSDRDAKRLYRWARILATYAIAALMFSTWIADFGLNYNVYAIVYGCLTLVGAVGNVAMVLFNAAPISNAIRNGRPAAKVPLVTRFLSYAWAPALIGFITFGWLQLAFDLVLERPIPIPLDVAGYGVFTSIIVVYGAINYVIERFFDRARAVQRINLELAAAAEAEVAADAPDGAAEPAAGVPSEAPADLPGDDTPVAPPRRYTIKTYEDLARQVAGILAFVAGLYALILILKPDSNMMTDTAGSRFLDVVTSLFIGYIVYNFFRIWIDSKIADETADQPAGEVGEEGMSEGASRLATLLPLFRGAILAIVIVSILLITMLELGINVSPLFAGAGVVGLAIGFGAQTLVRDIFSGAFFLIDDAFRKGEYIDIGNVKGTVEKISVRSFQLRHHLGALNTIPFGEIKVLINYSRDWVIMKLPLRVTYDTDVEKVRKLIKKLGVELLDDPVIGDNFIQPLKSQGVIEMQDSAMIIRVKFMTKPGDQWLVRKKVYEEIRALFAREGIRFAHREVTVRIADDKAETLTPQQKDAVAGAVQATMEEELPGGTGPRFKDDR